MTVKDRQQRRRTTTEAMTDYVRRRQRRMTSSDDDCPAFGRRQRWRQCSRPCCPTPSSQAAAIVFRVFWRPGRRRRLSCRTKTDDPDDEVFDGRAVVIRVVQWLGCRHRLLSRCCHQQQPIVVNRLLDDDDAIVMFSSMFFAEYGLRNFY